MWYFMAETYTRRKTDPNYFSCYHRWSSISTNRNINLIKKSNPFCANTWLIIGMQMVQKSKLWGSKLKLLQNIQKWLLWFKKINVKSIYVLIFLWIKKWRKKLLYLVTWFTNGRRIINIDGENTHTLLAFLKWLVKISNANKLITNWA